MVYNGNMKKQREKLLIIDGNALIHRSFHALPPSLLTKEGELVNAVYGFTAFLLKAIKEQKPTYVALTLDKKGPTFRHLEYKEYKATRTKAPDELYAQFGRVKQVAATLGVPLYELDGFEADDLIGTIAKNVGDQVDTIIVTGDMDTLQLVDDTTFVYAMSRGLSDSVLYDELAVKAKYGFGPERLIDYKGLRGDPSDNIPGVKGIGEKTASDLIADFGPLENIYKNLESDKIKPRIRELLLANEATAILSKKLATIHREAPITFDLERARWGQIDENQAVALFSELEFRSLLPKLKELLAKVGPTDAVKADAKFSRNDADLHYELIDDDKKFRHFLSKLGQQKYFAFDTETTGLDNFNCRLLGLSFAWEASTAYFVSLAGQAATEVNLFNFEEKTATGLHTWVKELEPILTNPKIKKCGHNLKFDLKVLGGLGINVQGVAFDSMIASYLLHPDNRQHSLDALSFTELGFSKISKEELTGGKGKNLDFAAVPPAKLASYSCEDADMSWRLADKLAEELQSEKLTTIFNTLEIPLVSVLARLENNGVLLDTAHLAKLDKHLDKEIGEVKAAVWELAGEEFNIASVQQLRKILFEKLAIASDKIAKTKTGLSTGAAELEKLKGSHPIIDGIVEYRELTKLSSTYVKALPELINSATGRLHTNYNQTVAATGRLSSTNPNLQNIPARTELGKEIRRAFIAPAGKVLLSLDYSQIELRIAAHLAEDPGMLHAFQNNLDIHTATAAAINKVPLEEVTKDMRRAAKATNFGLLYGQGARGLSETAGISYGEAKVFIDKYFAEFSHIKNYIEEQLNQARDKGYVITLFGRKRYLPEINSSIAMVRKSAERMAVNTPLQGTAADIIKKAMIEVDDLLATKYGERVKMIMQVHDELVFELEESLVAEAAKAIKKIMEQVIKLAVPLLVEAKAGKNWEEMSKIV
jgi:DNA polymerase-1